MHKFFNRSIKRLHRRRAALQMVSSPLHDMSAADLVDRLGCFRARPQMQTVLELGCHGGHILRHLIAHGFAADIRRYVMCDGAPEMVARARADAGPLPPDLELHGLCVDEEALPFPEGTFDLVISNCALHWVNDLEALFESVRKVLKPDGVFLGSMPGENTLTELNACFAQAEQELDGGVSPHVNPMVGGGDVSALLLNAGFTLPTVDIQRTSRPFPSAMDLMRHLKVIGENNALLTRRRFTPRQTIHAAAEMYAAAFPDGAGGIRATFETVNFVGWAPHDAQPKPKARGSGQISLKAIAQELGVEVQGDDPGGGGGGGSCHR
jgi:NADH dehydrogenase [ubiquinone] 1 alpha subcomplex assembly factor 5